MLLHRVDHAITGFPGGRIIGKGICNAGFAVLRGAARNVSARCQVNVTLTARRLPTLAPCWGAQLGRAFRTVWSVVGAAPGSPAPYGGRPGCRPSRPGEPAQRGSGSLSLETVPPGFAWPALPARAEPRGSDGGVGMEGQRAKGPARGLAAIRDSPLRRTQPPNTSPSPSSTPTVCRVSAQTVRSQPRLQHSDLRSNGRFEKQG